MAATDIHGGDASAIARRAGLPNIPPVTLDFSVNVNPFGMPLHAERTICSMSPEKLSGYPEPYASKACSGLARSLGLPENSLLLGNGSTEIFSWIVQTIKPRAACALAPCYSGYAEVCRAADIVFDPMVACSKGKNFKVDFKNLCISGVDLLFLASPNNPTGVALPRKALLDFIGRHPDTFFVVDESFVDFMPEVKKTSLCEIRNLPENVAVVRSLTKFFAIAGIRLGMVYAAPGVIAKFAKKRLPWSVNSIAQAVAPSLYSDKSYNISTRDNICELRKNFAQELLDSGRIKVYPAEANFFLCELLEGDVAALQAELLMKGALIRSCADIPGLDGSFFRLAVKDAKSNHCLAAMISGIPLEGRGRGGKGGRKFRPVMIVGTTSGAGKSIIAAAFCRHYARLGLKVAPFKAQNMSLNSYVTKEGGEMGRAQVVQARAAGVEPHTDMNPVLLKPTGDSRSQVIVNGKVAWSCGAREYYEGKRDLRVKARAAFDRLAARFELVVMEGAGSPAEINIMHRDFVNMDMACHADALTILVADIDPGGVFASIYGTLRLLPEHFRKQIAGIIINKFRGDVTLLDNGISEIETLAGVPVLGVMPFMANLDIEEEDSMGLDARRNSRGIRVDTSQKPTVDIAVIRLPRISNFTDFNCFEKMKGVNLRYVPSTAKLGTPDLIVIPGTKNTIADMAFMHDSGLSEAVLQLNRNGVPVIGICGGYQMLGEKISDPDNIEGDIPEIKALQLLECETVITKRKQLCRVEGEVLSLKFAEKGTKFKGYEIHMGVTTTVKCAPNDSPLKIITRRGRKCAEDEGATSSDNSVFGCYIHGLFDEHEIRTQLLQWLAQRKGIEYITENPETTPEKDPFDRIADKLKEHVKIPSPEPA